MRIATRNPDQLSPLQQRVYQAYQELSDDGKAEVDCYIQAVLKAWHIRRPNAHARPLMVLKLIGACIEKEYI
jgi:hypothetical protein